ncbi:hypothetical protein HELRODRAFT_160808 [Helobdella robusta]|uniref:Apple domain-containing protein n=1 Tax=Helobdella robusta TaxID=6412 RepID=T1EQR2_HELRO|nr:hypothetical protein HELRODRAFT_160808 [Helobdella robusta]ESO06618.1 hypothetical protein HELRODRAFT_160808 [Helobdella robusta]
MSVLVKLGLFLTMITFTLSKPVEKRVCWRTTKNKTIEQVTNENLFTLLKDTNVKECKKKCASLGPPACQNIVLSGKNCYYQINGNFAVTFKESAAVDVYTVKDCKIKKPDEEEVKPKQPPPKIEEKSEAKELGEHVAENLECVAEVFENVARNFENVGSNLNNAGQEIDSVADNFKAISRDRKEAEKLAQ